MITVDDIHHAAARIKGIVRYTPVMATDNQKDPLPGGTDLVLKLELLQVTESFKARGATNKLLSLPQEAISRGIVAASGGNHRIATARAGFLSGVPVDIFSPTQRLGQKFRS